MTIYVDEAALTYRGALYCHMMIDRDADLEELHLFAERLGLKRQWFQGQKPQYPHYDLSPRMRAKAIRFGAVEIESAGLLYYCKRGPLLFLYTPPKESDHGESAGEPSAS